MKQLLLILSLFVTLAVHAEEQEPSLIDIAYQGLSESLEGAVTDAQDIIADIKESCAPAMQELQTMIDDIRGDYREFAHTVDSSCRDVKTRCFHIWQRTLAYLGVR